MGFIHHVNVPDLCMFKCSMWILLVIYCYQNTECGPSFKPSVHRNYMPWVSSSSLSRSKPGVNIQRSNQIYQAVLTRVARQPANSHRHLTAFVFRNREGRGRAHSGRWKSLQSSGLPRATFKYWRWSPSSLVLSFAVVKRNIHWTMYVQGRISQWVLLWVVTTSERRL